MNDETALTLGSFQIKPTGLEIEGQPTFEEWYRVGQTLRILESAIQWVLGDWLNYGERAYGEMYSQALGETDYEYDTLASFSWVANKVEFCRRRQNLSFSHHKEVAPLPPDVQDYWLDLAAAEGLSRNELRAAIKGNPHVLYNTGENEWYTPSQFISAARRVMGDIDLDPASSEIANAGIKAKTYYTHEDDGLTKPWFGKVWMNPPYAQPLVAEFAAKLVMCYEQSEIEQACVLVNNATDTAWLQEMMAVCSSICFIKGRVKFLDPNGVPGAPLQGQVVLYFGSQVAIFSQFFSQFGVIYNGT